MTPAPAPAPLRRAYEFAGFRFDASVGLSRAGRELALAPTPMRVLAVLLGAQGRFVPRDEVVRAGWRGRGASEDSVSRCIYLMRRALAHPDGLEIVETAYGRGFRLAVPVRLIEADRATATLERLAQVRHPSAFETWAAARELGARGTPRDLTAALDILEAGLAAEPGYGPSWTLLGFLRILQTNVGWIAPSEGGRHALQAAARALALDPDDVDALAVQGFVRVAVDGSVAEGLADLERAVSIDSGHWLARHMSAWALAVAGRLEAALQTARDAHGLNPLAPRAAAMLATCLHFGGAPPAETRRAVRELVARPGANGSTWAIAAIGASLVGEHDEALESSRRALEADACSVPIRMTRADVLARAGRAHEARALLAELDASWPGAAAEMRAPVHLALGDRAAALHALRDGAARRGLHVGLMRADPRLADLVRDPALARLWHPLHGR